MRSEVLLRSLAVSAARLTGKKRLEGRRGGGPEQVAHLPRPPDDSWRAEISSHESFTHDSIDSLGYDWERIANPAAAPRFPLKVYLPRTTDDLIRILREAKSLGDDLRVRGKGHSSNGLVLTNGGS